MVEDVLGLTAQIVSAHVTRKPVPVEELLALIREVYKTLSTVGETPAPAGAPKPAVPVSKSVFPDYIVCLEDGKQMTMLKRHLRAEHKMTVDQYRAKWGLPPSYPMVRRPMLRHDPPWPKKWGSGVAELLRPRDPRLRSWPSAGRGGRSPTGEGPNSNGEINAAAGKLVTQRSRWVESHTRLECGRLLLKKSR